MIVYNPNPFKSNHFLTSEADNLMSHYGAIDRRSSAARQLAANATLPQHQRNVSYSEVVEASRLRATHTKNAALLEEFEVILTSN